MRIRLQMALLRFPFAVPFLLLSLQAVFCRQQQPRPSPEAPPEAASAAVSMRDSCETLPSTIQVTKDEYDDLGNVVRSCEGTIAVTKCEGTCNSQIQPSVITPTGFLKECHCCRETWMRQREILLTDCYTQDGKRIFGQQGTMVIHLKEPEACACHKCGL